MRKYGYYSRKISVFFFSFILGLLIMSCNHKNDGIDILLPIENQGRYIQNLSTNQSVYLPGETLYLSVDLSNPTLEIKTLKMVVKLKQLSEIFTEFTNDFTLELGLLTKTYEFQLPNYDYQGYSLEIYIYQNDTLIDYAMTGVDVSSTWNVFPRYAALSHYDYTDLEDVDTVLRTFKDFHINGLMYYDVIDSHDQPLAGDTLHPDESWNTINRSLATKTVLDYYIELGHTYQMQSFVYNLLFGGYESYVTRGIKPEWGLYIDPLHTTQDFHPLPSSWETSKLYLFNPGDVNWQNYYIQVMSNFLNVYDFDGIQADSLGSRGIRYDYAGNIVFLDKLHSNLLNRLKLELETQIIFNPVDGYGLDEILSQNFNDIIYVEIWEGNYNSLQNTLFNIYDSTEGHIGTVLAAYMNYGNEFGFFNEASVIYTNSVIIASGGSHLELVDTGMLSKEYYPGTMLQMTDKLQEKLHNIYSFQVAYENYLRGPGLVRSNNLTTILNYDLSNTAEQGKIWSFSRIKEDNSEVIHFINLLNTTSIDWVDSKRIKMAPVPQTNLNVKHYYSLQPTEIIVASPDRYEGISLNVPYTLGSDAFGNYVEFVLPSLEYYTMVIIR
ncbi:MAG: hypothetical protein CVU98_12200 [Firmicutes bacterium HGW-Firmicutes-3]|nr:MAG: hypothetical protein CVU98_12200 [Firmicutes bacterium HGW-Firmicutes-3]